MVKKFKGFIFALSIGLSVALFNLPSYAEALGPIIGEEGMVELSVTDEMIESADIVHLDDAVILSEVEDESNEIGAEKAYWEQFSSYYYYNQLSEGQKVLWDKFKEECLGYLTGTDDAKSSQGSNGKTYYRTKAYDVTAYDLTNAEVVQVISLFTYANPQFYFLSSSYYGKPNFAAIVFYDDFKKGEDRIEYTRQFKAQIDAWIYEIAKATEGYTGDDLCVKQETLAYNIVCDEFVYTSNANYNQSAVSGVLYKKTVCAGYTKTMTILLNAFGIENVAVSSTTDDGNHVWNEVLLNGTWFLTDATWGDREKYTANSALNTTCEGIDKAFVSVQHQPEYYKSLYSGISIPKCLTIMAKEKNYTIAAPSVSAVSENLVATVTINPVTSDSVIKYTKYQGVENPIAETDLEYTEPVLVNGAESEIVTARAVKTFYGDSRTVSYGFYQINFDGNGAETGALDPIKVTIDTDVTIPSVDYTKTKYLLNGWNTNADGTGYHLDAGKTYSLISDIPGDTVTLYAEWLPTEFDITYELNGGTNSEKNPEKYYLDSEDIILEKPSKPGYTFEGWYLDSEFKSKITKIEKGTKENITVYANYVANTYSIVFVGNGATSGSMAKMEGLVVDKSYKLTANGFKKEGYVFAGWSTSSKGKGEIYSNKSKVTNLSLVNSKEVKLYAQWEEKSFTIKYNLNGGKNNKSNPDTYKKSSKTITLKAPKKEGYTFEGWYSDSKFKNKVTKIDKGSSGTVKLYAKWSLNKYNIKFDGNGASSGKMAVIQNTKYTKEIKLPANTFKKKGYKFVGWCTDKKGKGTIYKNKSSVKKLTAKNGKTVTLYAIWKKK